MAAASARARRSVLLRLALDRPVRRAGSADSRTVKDLMRRSRPTTRRRARAPRATLKDEGDWRRRRDAGRWCGSWRRVAGRARPSAGSTGGVTRTC